MVHPGRRPGARGDGLGGGRRRTTNGRLPRSGLSRRRRPRRCARSASGGRGSSPATQAGAGRAFDERSPRSARRTGSTELLARAALGFSADLSGFEVRLFDQRQIDLLEEAAGPSPARDARRWRGRRAGPAVGGAVVDAPPTRRLELAEAAVALARASRRPRRARPLPGRPLRRDRRPRPRGRADGRGLRDHRHRRGRGDGPLELLGRRLRFVARLERGDVAGVEDEAGAFARRAEARRATRSTPGTCRCGGASGPDRRRPRRCRATGIDEADDARAGGREHQRPDAGERAAPRGALAARRLRRSASRCSHALGDDRPRARPLHLVARRASPSPTCGRGPTRPGSLLDRTSGRAWRRRPLDAEWMGNMVNIVRAAVALDHPILPAALELIEPFADLVAFEGIGAGLYGAMARFVAEGCSRRSAASTTPSRYAERALAVNRRSVACSRPTPCAPSHACTAAAGDPSGGGLHDEADAVYRGAGVRTPRSRRRHEHRDQRSAGGRGDNEWCRDGDVWHVTFGGTTTIVKHSKGMADLAALLVAPRARGARDRAGGRPGGGRSAGAGRRCSTGRRRRGLPGADQRPGRRDRRGRRRTTTPAGRREPAPSTTPSSTS